MKILSHNTLHATAYGKAILIGEHAVVYGFKALALALPDIKLTIFLDAFDRQTAYLNWLRVWNTKIFGNEVAMEDKINELLLKAFEKALKLLKFPYLLNDFFPQKIRIDSQIPLGGGMGGSAAISTCLIRLAAQIVNVHLTFQQEVEYANEVDNLFHLGKASGLDVSAVASDGVIEFKKYQPIIKLNNQCHFWLALIDSQERSETAEMIEKVKNDLNKNSVFIQNLFQNLNELTSKARNFLEQGLIEKFSECLNAAHENLKSLGISTNKINEIVEHLKKRGALAAKLTGAGGGGLVLGIFNEKPNFLFDLYGKNCVYITKV